jgi:peptide/nickel transport system substrate-binding protein
MLAVPLFVLSLLSQGCGSEEDTSSAREKIDLIYSRGADADRLDPIHTDNGETVKVMVNIYDTLIAYNSRTTQLVPSLATEWSHTADHLTWTFKLREGVLFHDGTEFDADAVVFNFERLTQKDHPHRIDKQVPMEPNYAPIESVKALDPLTVVFQLKHTSAVFLENLAMYSAGIVSPTALKERGESFLRWPCGTGPFMLAAKDDWKQEQQLVLTAFDDHWRGRPNVDRLIFKPNKESGIREENIRRGNTHIADNLPPQAVNRLKEQSGIVVQMQPGQNVAYLTMQNEHPPLDNVKVRRAIAMGIDKQELIRVAHGGSGRAAVNIVPPTIWGAATDIEPYPHDIEAAKALLVQAHEEDGVVLPIELKLAYMQTERPYMPMPQQTATFIKDELEKIGIKVTMEPPMENSLHFQRMSAGEHDLGLIGWSSDVNDPDNFLYNLMHSDNINSTGGNNLSRYRNDEFDALVTAAKRELDREKRKEMYRKAQQIMFDDVPTLPLVHTDVRVVLRDHVKGYFLHPTSMVRLRKTFFEKQEE